MKNKRRVYILAVLILLFGILIFMIFSGFFEYHEKEIETRGELGSLGIFSEAEAGTVVRIIVFYNPVSEIDFDDGYSYRFRIDSVLNYSGIFTFWLEVNDWNYFAVKQGETFNRGGLSFYVNETFLNQSETNITKKAYVILDVTHSLPLNLDSCSNESLIGLWGKVFKESSEGVFIKSRIPILDSCFYLLYKNTSSTEAFLISGSSASIISQMGVFQAIYLQGEENLIKNITDLELNETYSFFKDFLNETNIVQIYNRNNLVNTEAAVNEFNNKFFIVNQTPWQYVEDTTQSTQIEGYTANVSNYAFYGFSDTGDFSTYSMMKIGIVIENKTIDYFTYNFLEYPFDYTECTDSSLMVKGNLSKGGEVLIAETIYENPEILKVISSNNASINVSGRFINVSLSGRYAFDKGVGIVSNINFYSLDNLSNSIEISYIILTDHCEGDSAVEYICGARSYEIKYPCPNGCNEGVCIPYDCHDSDSGYNPNVKGEVTYSPVDLILREGDFDLDLGEEFNQDFGFQTLKVISETNATFVYDNITENITKGKVYKFPSGEIFVKNISYYGDNNDSNQIEISMNKSIDYCVDTTSLAEFSCEETLGPLVEQSYCSYGCTNGACNPCVENWVCGAWGSCIGGIKKRTCSDNNYCGTYLQKPALNASCTISTPSENNDDEEDDTSDDTNAKETLPTPPTPFTNLSSNEVYVNGKKVIIDSDEKGNMILIEDSPIVRTDLELNIEQGKLLVKTSAGEKELKILYDEAVSKATLVDDKKEVIIDEYKGKAVYVISGFKEVKLFFLFKINAKVMQKIAIDTGEVVQSKRPWWGFLASGWS